MTTIRSAGLQDANLLSMYARYRVAVWGAASGGRRQTIASKGRSRDRAGRLDAGAIAVVAQQDFRIRRVGIDRGAGFFRREVEQNEEPS